MAGNNVLGLKIILVIANSDNFLSKVKVINNSS